MATATPTGHRAASPSPGRRTARSARLAADRMTNRHRGATIGAVSVTTSADRRHGYAVAAVIALVALTVAASVVAAAIDRGNHGYYVDEIVAGLVVAVTAVVG